MERITNSDPITKSATLKKAPKSSSIVKQLGMVIIQTVLILYYPPC